jgi:hypothetical protein
MKGYLSPNQNVAMPRNEKNPTTSVTVVTKVPDATAGSDQIAKVGFMELADDLAQERSIAGLNRPRNLCDEFGTDGAVLVAHRLTGGQAILPGSGGSQIQIIGHAAPRPFDWVAELQRFPVILDHSVIQYDRKAP